MTLQVVYLRCLHTPLQMVHLMKKIKKIYTCIAMFIKDDVEFKVIFLQYEN